MDREPVHRRLVRLGDSNHGMVSRRALLADGIGPRRIDHQLERGALCPLFQGVYSVGGPPRTWRAFWAGATLAAGPGSVLCGMAAAGLWGLTESRPDQIDVLRPGAHNRAELSSPACGRSVKLRTWTRPHLPKPVLLDGIPVLPVPELLLDLAGRVTSGELEALVSAASQKRHLNEKVVARLLESGRGRKGIERLRHELRFWDSEMRNVLSVLESRFLAVCKREGIEVPRTNQKVCGLMVDFVWPRRRIVVEVDGYAFHGDRIAFERDHERQAILTRNGYVRLSFTWRQVNERPDAVVETVRAALALTG